MTPDLIKAYLDRKPWKQSIEDRFHGVDGRKTPKEHWLKPLPGVLPDMGTKNEREEAIKRDKEERMILDEKIKNGEIKEEDYGPACGLVRSNYNLKSN
jgi:hypothetical protein